MTQNLEIEFKNMLTKAEYQTLLQFFHITGEQIFSQENHYFDTPDFALKHAGSALRIRQKQYTYEMTLKQPMEAGLLETNQQLGIEETALAIQSGQLPAGEIKLRIESMAIPFSTIEYFGSLKTNRAELAYKGGLLVLDHSCYLNKEDFELEFEAQSFQEGKQIFQGILEQFCIPERETKNKIQRFYDARYSKSNDIEEINS